MARAGGDFLLTNLLFICSRNRLRSPTAEQVFAAWPGVETASAGLAPDADEPCTDELVEPTPTSSSSWSAPTAPGSRNGSERA